MIQVCDVNADVFQQAPLTCAALWRAEGCEGQLLLQRITTCVILNARQRKEMNSPFKFISIN